MGCREVGLGVRFMDKKVFIVINMSRMFVLI